MDSLRFGYFSIGSLAGTILVGVITGYLLSRREKGIDTWYLTGYLGILFLLNLSYTIRYSLFSPVTIELSFLSNSIVFGVVCLIQFAYHYGQNIFPKESKIVLILSLTASLAIWLSLFFMDNVVSVYDFENQYFTYEHGPRIAIFTQAGFCWAIIIFFRKLNITNKIDMRPASDSSMLFRSIRSFALLTIFTSVLPFLYLLFQFDIISRTLYNGIFNTGSLFICIMIFIVYINNTQIQTSILIKIVGVPLALIMAAFGMTSNFLMPIIYDEIIDRYRRESENIVRAISSSSSDNMPLHTAYVLQIDSTNANFRFLSESIPDGLSDEIVGFSQSVAINNPSDETKHVSHYINLRDVESFFFLYEVQQEEITYHVGFKYSDFRNAVHQFVYRIALSVVVTAIAMIFGFPLAYKWGLLFPLESLLTGVRQLEKGEYGISLTPRFNDELGYVTRAFNDMASAVEKVDRMKNRFLANTSHELRTPLHGIIGIGESLMEGVAGPLTEEAARNMEMIISSGKRLSSLVDDILDFSRLKEGDLVLRRMPVDIRELTEVVISLSRILVKGKDLELINEIDERTPTVLADPDRLQQIMLNLLGNGIKYTDKGSVAISSEIKTDKVLISVRDTGVGIDSEDLDRIFEPFEQSHNHLSGDYGGTGLGLSITRKLIELHGESIGFESEIGKGSCFHFSLPICGETPVHKQNDSYVAKVYDQSSTESLHAVPRFESNSRINILIVDDEPINLNVLSNQLTLSGYHVIQTANGEDALKVCSGEILPDLVLLDIMMPKMNGYKVCRILREKFPISELPVILLTAKNQVSDLVEGFEAGANDYISKPFSKNELMARIRTQLELSKINIAYGHFVPHDFLRILHKESIIDVRLGDQVQQNMTIMFSDIRSFTTFSEQMSPKETFDFINSYLKRVVPLIRSNKGIIDKFIGDAIMALFPDTVDDALKASVDMQREIDRFNEYRSERKEEPIQVGIGLHMGKLIVGTIGEEHRMEETVISDAVNLTSRIEGLNRLYGTNILISETLLNQLKNKDNYNYRFLGKVQVKGKSKMTSVYEVLDGCDKRDRELKISSREEFMRGLKSYYQRNFAEAALFFNNVLKSNNKDIAAQLYRDRSAGFVVNPPPEHWDGIETIKTK